MQRNFRIKANRSATCPSVYANYCEATHSPFDITLTFCSLTGVQPEDVVEGDDGGPTVLADPQMRVTVPVRMVPALIKMLTLQMRALEEGETPESGQPEPEVTNLH